MEIGSAFSAGLQGFQRASDNITQATQNINDRAAEQRTLAEEPQQAAQAQQQQAQQAQQSTSLESDLITLTNESNIAQANVRAVETADEVLGSIIDIRV